MVLTDVDQLWRADITYVGLRGRLDDPYRGPGAGSAAAVEIARLLS
jgi:hypothetical protein